jgi:hypothetical protein
MSLNPLQIQELLDENRAHECDGFGMEHICVRIASITIAMAKNTRRLCMVTLPGPRMFRCECIRNASLEMRSARCAVTAVISWRLPCE